MDGEGRRHLPSWMLRPCTFEETSISEAKQETDGNDSKEVDTIASQPQKKVKRKKPNLGLPLDENRSHPLIKCQGRTRDRKFSYQEEAELENQPHLLKQCRARKSKGMYNLGKDQGHELALSNPEKDDGPMRKKLDDETPGKKKANKSVEDSHEGTLLSEDELTTEDLVRIAQEYVNAEMELKILKINSETKRSIDAIRSEKCRTVEKEERKLLTHQPLSDKSSSTDPPTDERSINYPINTGDPVRDMLDLLLGGLLKKSEEAERKR